MAGTIVWVLLGLCGVGVLGMPRDGLYPYGAGSGDRRLTRGDDVRTGSLRLQVPIAFYSESYDSIFMNLNGILSFRTSISEYDASLEMPFNHPVIAPFYSDVDTRASGNVYFRETLDPDMLTRAAQKIWRNYPNWRDYEPISLLVVTWDEVGYYDQKDDKKNTYQVVIASDGDNSFVFLHYPDDGLNWVQADGKDGGEVRPAQAGFDSGDGRSRLMPASGTPSVKNLYGWSNIRERGVWLFRVGNLGTGDILNPEDDIDVEPEEPTTPAPNPTSCAAGGSRFCHETAECADYQGGYCCHCKPPSVGNGINCLTPSASKRVLGSFEGTINEEVIESVDMHAFIVPSDGRTYTSIGRVSHSVGVAMQALYPLGGILGFMFAKPLSPTAMNGFMATGGEFNMSATVRFMSGGEVLNIQQNSVGKDESGYMRVNTQVQGYLPIISADADVRVDDYRQEFTRVSQGVIRSNTIHTYRIDGIPYRFQLQQVFNYKECEFNPLIDFLTMRVSATRHYITFNQDERIVRYVQINRIESVESFDPCENAQCNPRATCVPDGSSYECICGEGFTGDGQTCTDIDECASGAHDCHVNADCINRVQGFECVCRDGYSGDGKDCSQITCADVNCDYNAHCVFDFADRTPTCVCNSGFIGDGYDCRPIEFGCNEVNNCDENAECEYNEDSGRYECVCNDGYSGDGLVCTDTGETTDCQRCDPNARCEYDVDRLSYMCKCRPDYTGDGYTCSLIAVSCNVINNCDIRADCVYVQDTDSYQCRCHEGYHGDGIICQEATCEIANNCGQNARCLFDNRLSTYQCVCNPGYLGDGYRCQEEGCNVQDFCDQNAQCVYMEQTERYQCQCNEGYEGDGKSCRLIAIPCNQLNNCDINADCVLDPGSSSYVCRCKQGYEGDGYSCRLTADCRRDTSVCDRNAQCVPRGTDYICACSTGYRGNGYTCSPLEQRSSYLLYAQGNSILSVPFQPTEDNRGEQVIHQPGMLAVGIDNDCDSHYFYWTDVVKRSLSRAKLDGSDADVLVTGLSSPEGVAVDWLAGNIYWTDSESDSIGVARSDGTHRKIIISGDLVNPRAITADPVRGLLFWADWNRGAPKIERAYMDGSNRVTIVEDDLGLPNGLTIDFDTYNICWGDAGTMHIDCANYEGKNRRVIYDLASYPFGLAYANNIFYWTDWDKKTLPNINQFASSPNEALILPPGGNGRMYGITTVRSECPRGTNACRVNNGGCRFLCLPTPNGGRTCQCPDDIEEEECNRIGLFL